MVKSATKLSTDVTVEEFRRLGADLMNRSASDHGKVFQERWTAHFEVEPEVVANVWQRLVADIEEEDALEDKFAGPSHLLWALLFLKIYSTEAVLSSMCGVDEDTYRKWAWHLIDKVSYLECEVVSHSSILSNYTMRNAYLTCSRSCLRTGRRMM
jgi:hypothetical protein